MREKLLIVGGSYAACNVASQARASGYDGDIIMISEEHELPYHRPPLSKAFLKDQSTDVMPIQAPGFYTANNIELEQGVKVVDIESGANAALLSDGSKITFDTLALTVGARPRRISCEGGDAANVYYLRSVADARLIRAAAEDAQKVVVVGAGFIGLEVASVFLQQQKEVTIVETEDRVLARAVSPETSEYLQEVHVARGLTLLTGRKVESFSMEKGMVRNVRLNDGTVLDADIVIVGIGSIVNLELAANLGLQTQNGILVDSQSRTSRPNVFAAGDCAQHRSIFNSNGIRLESVQNAIDQSRVAGAVIAGADKHYHSLPWFWSDQHELNIQIAGIASTATDRIVRHVKNGISVFHFRDNLCVCVETVNCARDHALARRVLTREQITRRQLEDVEFDMSALSTG